MSYDIIKALHSLAFLAMSNKGQIEVDKAAILLYLADRESIKHFGDPFQNELRLSTKKGPMNIYSLSAMNGDFFKYDQQRNKEWPKYFTNKSKENIIFLQNKNIKIDDLGYLSESNIKILEEVWNQFGSLSLSELSEWTKHHISEWKKPQKNEDEEIITLEDIMVAVGLNQAKERAEELESLDRAQDVLSGLAGRSNSS